MHMGKLAVTIIVAFLLVSSMPFATQRASGTLLGVELVASRYTGTNVYVPGETLDIILRGSIGDIYDIIIGSGNTTGLDLRLYQDISIGSSGSVGNNGTVKLQYTVPDELPDGLYRVDIYDSQATLYEPYQILPGGHENFEVRGYRFVIETDRAAYLGGDAVNIFWTANNIKDESLAYDGVGKIVVVSGTGQKLAEQLFSKAAGSYTYMLPQLIDPDPVYWVAGWFNDSAVNPERSQSAARSFDVGQLGVIVQLDAEVYAPGAIVVATVKTVATENRDNPSATNDPPEPSCDIEFQVGQKISGQYVPIAAYDREMVSDVHGYANCVFQLATSVADGTDFRVIVNATKGSRSWSGLEFFKISTSAGLSIVISLDKSQYTSGDVVSIGTTVTTIGSPGSTIYTYVYEIRDNRANGSLFARATASQAGFNYSIRSDFEGTLWISVTVDDGKGNKATVYKLLDVKYAVVLVNADLVRYVPGDSIRVGYSLVSRMMGSPSIYYEVLDADGASVSEGNATGGSFDFTVPNAPSASYTFRVMASEGGRLVYGEDSVEQMAGYVILMTFNRGVYAPGETIAVKYHIVSLGSTPMPATFQISYGLTNGPTKSTQTNASEGTLLYIIPVTLDEGDQVFWMYANGGGASNEIITIKDNPNPLWYTRIMDLPLVEILLIMLVLLCFVLIARNSRRMRQAEPSEPEEPSPSKATQPRPKRQSSSAPAYSVACDACSTAIEISTSKRPIEVMCPACGETQIVLK